MSAVPDPAIPKPVQERLVPANDQLVYLGAGPLLAVVLGFALIPFRESIGASNLSFAFVVLTVAISAFGGRGAGVATALASALSLDFFLTRPYMSLRIYENHDVIAFVGLTLCGLVAASLGSAQRIATLHEMRAHAGLLHRAVAEVEAAGPVEEQLGRVLERGRQVLPVRALVVRDRNDRVIASAPHRAGLEAVPEPLLEPDTLLPRGAIHERLRAAPALPAQGGRLALSASHRPQGWLDLWGDGAPATVEARRMLTSLARIAGALLARDVQRS